MTATIAAPDRVALTEDTIAAARSSRVPNAAKLVFQTADGHIVELPRNVERMLRSALQSVQDNGTVTLSRTPEELTSTVAAGILGVSRPTLMKWAADGTIKSFKVRTHTRFRRDDVLALRDERFRKKTEAFHELREFDRENDHLFED